MTCNAPALGSQAEQDLHRDVEQCQAGRSGFSAAQLNSTDNLMKLPTDVHRKISAFYSSNVAYLNQTVRETLTGLSYEEQFFEGMIIINQAINGKLK
ncbi:hypothetical protein [Herbaspirillum sp. YR522]|uniref:hypothetical protein n=1 Tax=Herbaspirillum sp. YR522 TaxID=1144342 RepID=UPI0012F88DBB|nr:hypothetical protein [Herbaspirillum sp. YR522]